MVLEQAMDGEALKHKVDALHGCFVNRKAHHPPATTRVQEMIDERRIKEGTVTVFWVADVACTCVVFSIYKESEKRN